MSEFIEFTIHSRDRLHQLRRVVLELQRDKADNNRRDSTALQSLFDQDALSHFSWPTPEGRVERLHDLATRPVLLTPTEQAVGQCWDFDSMIHAIMEGEYDLLGCEPSVPGKAVLRFDAQAYPYGGVGALVALVEAFGFAVSGIDDGTGYLAVADPGT